MSNANPHQSIDEALVHKVSKRIVDRSDLLESVSDSDNGLTRVFCSPAMNSAHGHFRQWMNAAAMDCRLDAVGNLIGTLGTPEDPDQPVFLVGSHLDTVINAGRFDGTLGALLGLGVAELISESSIELNFNLDVVGFSEEEGVRYQFPFIGSLGLIGGLTDEHLSREDDDGVSMRDALREFDCDVGSLESASYYDRDVVGFMEAHIEQADLLQDEDLSVGVVSAIAGQTRANICFTGKAGHAGTVLHDRRQDALAAAAELILKIESIGQQTDGLYATVGCIETSPGLSNVISGRTEVRLDLRHESDDVRHTAFEEIQAAVESISTARNVAGEITNVQRTRATKMDDELIGHIESAVTSSGLTVKNMVSGAGHDAMIMARIAPSCMLFVRCKDGVSHHPDEFVSPEDVFVALKVMTDAVIRISETME